MIKFLFKGLLRDSSRSRLPIIIVALGVMLTVLLTTWMKGILGDMVSMNANFNTGHVKVMTRPYADNSAQLPNDLALLGVKNLSDSLSQAYPNVEWVSRIRFGGLLDIPDETGNTRTQGPVSGISIDLLSPDSKESERMNITKSIIKGKMPTQKGEVLVSDAMAERLSLKVGDEVTYFGSTMNGAMTFANFKMVGTIGFGVSVMDRGTMIIDIQDARTTLDMEDGAGEVLGYFPEGLYDDGLATTISNEFNANFENSADEFAPVMLRLRDQNDLSTMLDYSNMIGTIFISIFVFAMSIVLWNTGLLGGLRRYTEFGVRLALGEGKTQIFTRLLIEATFIGVAGSLIGTAVGLAGAYYLQEVGVDFSSMMGKITMMVPSVYKARITPEAYYLGFIPGLLSIILGNALAGIGIYKRNTAQLFKELEV